MILYFRWIEYLEILKNWEIEYNRNFAEIYFWSKMADPTFSRTRRQLRIIAVQKWPQLEKKVKYDIYDLFSSLFCPPFIIETNLRIIKHPMCIYLFPGFEHQRIYFRSKRNTNKYNRTYFFFFSFHNLPYIHKILTNIRITFMTSIKKLYELSSSISPF